MDFSNHAFRPVQMFSTFSNDTMGHAQKVQACRWGWSVEPAAAGTSTAHTPAPAPVQTRTSTTSHAGHPNRLVSCRGRLYHQLTCSHRIRTDLVEDCGANCLEPTGTMSSVPFFCQDCVDREANSIWNAREVQHNALYPPLDQMSKDQYDLWYDERRKLEARFARDRDLYIADLKARTRPTNTCSALQLSDEEKQFAAELDSLSLAMISTSSTATNLPSVSLSANPTLQPSPPRKRISLPSDTSEQIHWSLNALALDRGSCGVEYSASQPANHTPPMGATSEEDLWRRPRER